MGIQLQFKQNMREPGAGCGIGSDTTAMSPCPPYVYALK